MLVTPGPWSPQVRAAAAFTHVPVLRKGQEGRAYKEEPDGRECCGLCGIRSHEKIAATDAVPDWAEY